MKEVGQRLLTDQGPHEVAVLQLQGLQEQNCLDPMGAHQRVVAAGSSSTARCWRRAPAASPVAHEKEALPVAWMAAQWPRLQGGQAVQTTAEAPAAAWLEAPTLLAEQKRLPAAVAPAQQAQPWG